MKVSGANYVLKIPENGTKTADRHKRYFLKVLLLPNSKGENTVYFMRDGVVYWHLKFAKYPFPLLEIMKILHLTVQHPILKKISIYFEKCLQLCSYTYKALNQSKINDFFMLLSRL